MNNYLISFEYGPEGVEENKETLLVVSDSVYEAAVAIMNTYIGARNFKNKTMIAKSMPGWRPHLVEMD